MTDFLKDLTDELAGLRARHPYGDEPPPLVLARLMELYRVLVWAETPTIDKIRDQIKERDMTSFFDDLDRDVIRTIFAKEGWSREKTDAVMDRLVQTAKNIFAENPDATEEEFILQFGYDGVWFE